MSKKPEQDGVDVARRGFLRKAGLAGGAAAAAAVVTTEVAAAPAPGETPAKPGQQGYHETDHVRAYYETARI